MFRQIERETDFIAFFCIFVLVFSSEIQNQNGISRSCLCVQKKVFRRLCLEKAKNEEAVCDLVVASSKKEHPCKWMCASFAMANQNYINR